MKETFARHSCKRSKTPQKDVLKQQHVRSEGGRVRVGSEETRGKEGGGLLQRQRDGYGRERKTEGGRERKTEGGREREVLR